MEHLSSCMAEQLFKWFKGLQVTFSSWKDTLTFSLVFGGTIQNSWVHQQQEAVLDPQGSKAEPNPNMCHSRALHLGFLC